MQLRIVICLLISLCVLSCAALAGASPVIKADQQYYDINTGLYILKGNVYVQVKDRIITASMARVSVGSLEVWGTGGIRLTQGDITFTGDSVYVYGSQSLAKIEGGISFSRNGLKITADRGEYNWRSKIGTFSGNVVVNQYGNVWTTNSLSYNVETNTIL